MRNIIYITLLSLFCLPAMGQQDLYSWKLKGYAGAAHYYNTDIENKEYSEFNENWLYRLEVVKNLSNSFALSASSTFGNIKGVDFFDNTFNTETRMGSLRLYFYTDNGWLFSTSSLIAPYIYGGVGLSRIETGYNNQILKSSDNTVFPFGAGLKIRLSERFNFELQAEGVYGADDPIKLQSIRQNEYNNLYLHAGAAVSYSFGFRKTSFTAPRFFAGEPYVAQQPKPRDPVSQNMIEAIIKPEVKDTLKVQKKITPEYPPVIKPKPAEHPEAIALKDSSLVQKDTLTSDTSTYKIVIKDTMITMEATTPVADSLLAPTDTSAKAQELKQIVRDTTFVIKDTLQKQMVDTTLKVLPGDSVLRTVAKIKTPSGKDSVIVHEKINRVVRDSIRVKQDVKIIPATDTTVVKRDTLVRKETGTKKKEATAKDTVVVIKYVRDTVYTAPDTEKPQDYRYPETQPEPQEKTEPDRYVTYDDYYRDQSDPYRYNEPSSHTTIDKQTIEKTIYVPQEISGGYIVGVVPDGRSTKADTLNYKVIQSYFDSLSTQNRALMLMVDSLNNRLVNDSLVQSERSGSTIIYTPAEQNAAENSQLLLEYMNRQTDYNATLRAKYDTLEAELNKIRLANATMAVAAAKDAEIKALNDSIARLNTRINRKPAPEPKKDIIHPKSTVYFKTGSNNIPSGNFSELAEIAETIKKDADLMIQVAGYSDLSGNPNTNMILSRKRAEAVALHLQKSGVPKNRILIQYFGDTKALEKANPLDRKVEVQIINKQ